MTYDQPKWKYAQQQEHNSSSRRPVLEISRSLVVRHIVAIVHFDRTNEPELMIVVIRVACFFLAISLPCFSSSFLVGLQFLSMITSEVLVETSSNRRGEQNMTNAVTNVAIVGGTHGNELHGIYFVDEFTNNEVAENMKELYPTITIKSIIANPGAVAAIGTGAGRRYCDVDLNRCFLMKDLADPSVTTIEGLRAKELDRELGPKSSPNPNMDFIFDVHSSTSNTGVLLCFHPEDKFSWQVAAYLQSKHPDLSTSLWAAGEVPLLPSIARSGMTVEVGPIAHSTANSALYHKTKEVLNDALQYIEMHNLWVAREQRVESLQQSVKVQFYERVASVGFPRDAMGRISALIHPLLQGRHELMGGVTIKKGSPVFQTLRSGEDIYYGEDTCASKEGYIYRVERASATGSEFSAEAGRVADDGETAGSGKRKRGSMNTSGSHETDEELYPMFINEAAYNEKDVAFVLMRKTEQIISIVSSHAP